MGKVFSWKIDDYKYGYIKAPNETSHISERITNPSILSSMAETVNGWDLSTYTEKFNELNEEVTRTFGVSIPGTAEDYFGNGASDKNYIVLTGKDGSSNCQGESLKQSDIEKIGNIVNQKLNSALDEIESLETNLKSWVAEKTNSTVVSVSAITQSTVNSVNAMAQELENKINDAENAIQTAASLFDMNNSGVNKENLMSTINKTNSAMTWAVATDAKNKQTEATIENMNNHISLLEQKQDATSSKVDNINLTVQTNIGRLNSKITQIENNVTNIMENTSYASETSVASRDNAVLSSSSTRKAKQSVGSGQPITTVVENKDGTYISNIKIGNESYDINIIGYGGKIDDETTKEGLSLASNGFKYVNNGSFFSMTDGNIKLSNADGSASIEINENGVYINGRKQR